MKIQTNKDACNDKMKEITTTI